MVYDEVVDLAVADHPADVLEQAAAERLLDGVDQGDLLADYQVGVVRNAIGSGQRPSKRVVVRSLTRHSGCRAGFQ